MGVLHRASLQAYICPVALFVAEEPKEKASRKAAEPGETPLGHALTLGTCLT